MPFQRELDNVWHGAIKPACADLHFASLRVDEVNLSSLITEDIERFSSMADAVIVDLTGSNANVMFEFGWSLAKKQEADCDLPRRANNPDSFDVRGIRYIAYENTWLGVETLKRKLKENPEAADHQSSKGKAKRAATRKKSLKETSKRAP